jgi:hypothetical protein
VVSEEKLKNNHQPGKQIAYRGKGFSTYLCVKISIFSFVLLYTFRFRLFMFASFILSLYNLETEFALAHAPKAINQENKLPIEEKVFQRIGAK